MSTFSINHLRAETILTQYQKVMDQTDTIKRLETKLRNAVKDKNQLCNLPFTF